MFRVYAFDEGNEMTAQEKSPFVLELKRRCRKPLCDSRKL